MQPSWVAIDPVVLRRMYVEEGLTAEEIATRIGCAATTVFRRLRGAGIARRPRGPTADRSTDLQAGGSWGFDWTPELAWVVGLIATDGNLSPRNALAITSKDRDLLETVKSCLGLTNNIGRCRNGMGLVYSKLQWRDRRLYSWFTDIGLTPAKSLTLGSLKIPDEHLADFIRGCIDGDGSIVVYTDRYHATKKERYVYERLYVSLVSASHAFIDWVQGAVGRVIGAKGALSVRVSNGHSSRGSGALLSHF